MRIDLAEVFPHGSFVRGYGVEPQVFVPTLSDAIRAQQGRRRSRVERF